MIRSIQSKCGGLVLRWLAITICAVSTGCAALQNPVMNGIPVQLLPPELLAESKANMENLPLTSLRQPPPEAYKLAPEDVLGIWIDGILGEKGQAPPVHYSENPRLPPAMGIPVPVRANGTIGLPFIDPIKVAGLTVDEVEQAIRKAYTKDKQILQPGRDRVYVTLQHPRQYHILVIRQDSGSNAASGAGTSSGGPSTGFVISPGGASTSPGGGLVRSGRGFAIDLPAYENDVLNALARTGGFPGSDALNELVIERGRFNGEQGRADVAKKLQEAANGINPRTDVQTIRIPLRYRKGEKPVLTPEMITLQTGDVVYIAARQSDVYYTGGLLPPAKFILPRDVDVDVVEAILLAGGVMNSGGVSALNTGGRTAQVGVGSPSPRLVSVLRRTADGGQVNIRVDLSRAQRDPRERILVQAKDIIILEQDPQDAIAGYLSTAFHYVASYTLINSSRANLGTTLSGP